MYAAAAHAEHDEMVFFAEEDNLFFGNITKTMKWGFDIQSERFGLCDADKLQAPQSNGRGQNFSIHKNHLVQKNIDLWCVHKKEGKNLKQNQNVT